MKQPHSREVVSSTKRVLRVLLLQVRLPLSTERGPRGTESGKMATGVGEKKSISHARWLPREGERPGREPERSDGSGIFSQAPFSVPVRNPQA